MVAPEDITRHHDWAARKNDDIWVGRRPAPEPVLTVVDSADEATYVPALEAAGFLLAIREPHWHQHRAFKGDDPRVKEAAVLEIYARMFAAHGLL